MPAGIQNALTNFQNLVNTTIEFLKSNTDYNNANNDSAITNVVYALCFGISDSNKCPQ